MTTRHFKAFAAALLHRRPVDYAFGVTSKRRADQQWERDVTAVANVCASFNERFNKRGFYEAAGFAPESIVVAPIVVVRG